MSGELPSVRPRKLVRALERAGWKVDRIRGSHYVMVNKRERRALTVPVHNRDLKPGTLAAILRAAGLTREDLSQLL